MPAPSLTQLTRRVITKNISMLTDIGDIPYNVIRPVLLKIENPKQLQLLEEASPQLYGVDGEIWIALIKRDIPDAEKRMLYPKNPKSWWKVYRKMRQVYETEAQEDAARLKAAFTGLKSEKDKRQILVKEGIPHIPKLDGMQFAHAAEYNRIKKPVKIIRPTSTVLSFGAGAGSKTRVLTGKGVMDKARREAQEMSRRRSQSSMAVPTHKLSSLATQIREAPKHMVEEYRRASASPPKLADPPIRKPAIFVPPKRQVERKDESCSSGVMTLEEKERRLRALTNPNSAAKAATTTSSSITSTTPGSSAKKLSASSTAAASRSTSTASFISKSKSGVSKVSPATSSASPSSTLKRKAKDSPILPSIEADDFGSASSQIKTTPSPPRYKIPRLTKSPEASGVRPPKKKAPVDPFIPVKKRRTS
ncbi:MAG: hypothetical protein Q9225_003538 [Loekoesia sp. 1 TL-2023]